MTTVDYIIVGQGLSGSILAYHLIKAGKKVVVFDEVKENSASKVAIGLVNPITGKRLVKSWLIDELLPASIEFYSELEDLFAQQFIHHTKINRIIPNQDIFEQWQPNFLQAIEEGYIQKEVREFHYGTKSFQYFSILKGFWLNTIPLLQSMKEYFIKFDSFENQRLKTDDINFENDFVRAKNYKADGIIFSTGSASANFGLFQNLPFNLNKGEVIDVKFPNLSLDFILKKNIFIVPSQNNFRIGSTYDRDFDDNSTTKKALNYFKEKTEELIGENYSILKHQAAIRPATVDRRPFIGTHQSQKRAHVFNGFGAKGVSMIPYFSLEMVNYLLKNEPINKEASINRYL